MSGECGYLTREQLAERWGCPVETIKKLEKAGTIKATRSIQFRRHRMGFDLNRVRAIECHGLAALIGNGGARKAGSSRKAPPLVGGIMGGFGACS